MPASRPAGPPIVTADKVSKWYGQVIGLNDVSVNVPPGITGWWQVDGRSDKPMHLNTQDDLDYIQHYSIWLDLKILWMTVFTVVKGQGAF